jgi:hypothetical protein
VTSADASREDRGGAARAELAERAAVLLYLLGRRASTLFVSIGDRLVPLPRSSSLPIGDIVGSALSGELVAVRPVADLGGERVVTALWANIPGRAAAGQLPRECPPPAALVASSAWTIALWPLETPLRAGPGDGPSPADALAALSEALGAIPASLDDSIPIPASHEGITILSADGWTRAEDLAAWARAEAARRAEERERLERERLERERLERERRERERLEMERLERARRVEAQAPAAQPPSPAADAPPSAAGAPSGPEPSPAAASQDGAEPLEAPGSAQPAQEASPREAAGRADEPPEPEPNELPAGMAPQETAPPSSGAGDLNLPGPAPSASTEDAASAGGGPARDGPRSPERERPGRAEPARTAKDALIAATARAAGISPEEAGAEAAFAYACALLGTRRALAILGASMAVGRPGALRVRSKDGGWVRLGDARPAPREDSDAA